MRMSLLVFFYLICQDIAAQQFTLRGKVIGKDTGIVILEYINANYENISDSGLLRDGSFEFKGSVNGVDYVFLITDTNYLYRDGKVNGFFFIEPGVIEITFSKGDMKNAKISGSAVQEELERWRKVQSVSWESRNDILLEMDSIRELLKNGSIESAIASKKIDSLRQRFFPIRDTIFKMDLSYIKHHPDSYLSLKLLDDYAVRLIPEDSVNILYAKFTDNVKNSSFALAFRKMFNTNSKNIKLTFPFDDVKVHDEAPAFSVYGSGAVSITNKSLKGQVTLLEFWSLTCLPCLQFNPELERLRKKYNERGLKVIAISRTKEQELPALFSYIRKNKFSQWIHVSLDMKSGPANNQVFNGNFDNYHYPGLPRTVLIDKKGKVIYKEFGYSPEESKRLEAIIGAAVNEVIR